MKNITLILTYYDNPGMLAEQVSHWELYGREAKDRVRVIVVDDGSPGQSAASVLDGDLILREMDVRVYRVIPDIPWNQDGARNLAMRELDTEWALLTDIDHVLTSENADRLLSFKPAEGCYYMPQRRTVRGDVIGGHPNSFLFSKCDFWHAGGYDEDFCGWYGSDGNFRKCARGSGLSEVQTTAFALHLYKTDDVPDANTRRYGRKDSPYYAPTCPTLNAKRRGPPYRAQQPIRFEWRREI